MAELSVSYRLCSGRCTGARQGRHHNELLLTFERGSVQVYDILSQSCTSSWQLPSNKCIVCPAIYHTHSKQYWAVCAASQNENISTMELVSWQEGAESMVGKAVRLTFRPFALLTAQTIKHPIVVYENGGVAMGGVNPQLPDRTRRSQRASTLLLADIFHDGEREYVCVVSSTVASGNAVALWSLDTSGLSSLSQSSLHGDGTDNVNDLQNCCVCGQSLVAISGGSVLTWNLMDQLTSQSLPPARKHVISSQPIKSHLATVSGDYFAIVNVDSKQPWLTIWDVAYLTNQAASELTSDPLRICCVGSYVVVCGPDDVTVVMVTIGHDGGTLAAALGRGQSSSEVAFKDASLSTFDNALPRMPVDCQGEVVSQLVDRDKTPTLEQFMSKFKVLTDMDYTPVVQRLLGETEFWAKEALTNLLEKNLFPSSLVGEVLLVCLEKRDWELTSTVLKEYHDCIPESILVKVLETVIKLPDSLEDGVTKDNLINLLLSVPVNDALIHKPLAQLTFPSVVFLLDWLCCQVGIQQLLGSSHQQLGYDSVLDWISILVDVHFTQLALHPHTKHLLLKLHKSIFKQMKCLDHLSIVGAAQEATKATPTSDSWLYKIEKLPIKI